MELIEHLKRMPLFAGLDAPQLETLSRGCSVTSFRAGTRIFSEGDEANGFHLVLDGSVKIYKMSPDGREQTLHIWGPGEMFGEVAVFNGGRFPAHADGLSVGRSLFVARETVVALLERDPALSFRLMGSLCQRLHRFASLIEDLSLREVPSRLAAYLLQLPGPRTVEGEDDISGGSRGGARRHDTPDPVVTLEVSKGQLASLLGTIPETLSRILSRMAREELIDLEGGRRIRLLDLHGLEEMASGERRLR